MERINRTLSLVMLAGLIGIGTLGAGDPATQPAAKRDAAVTAAPSTGDAAQANPQQGRNGRRNRTNRGDSSSPGSSAVSGTGIDKYAVLKSRSIFVKGNQTIAGDNNSGRPRPTPGEGGLIGKPSSSLVFNGVIVMGEEPNAMIEDQGNNSRVFLLRVGDQIATGKLSSITFDEIVYEENGNQKKVQLGQNLDGVTPMAVVVAPPSTQPGLPPTADSTGAPAAGAAPSGGTAGGSSADDILAKMKAKRNAELGIK